MLIGDLVLPIFIIGLLFAVIASIMVYLACQMLQDMPDNEKENGSMRHACGPERSARIVLMATWLLFAVSSILLAIDMTVVRIIGIGLMLFSVMLPSTGSLVAFAVINLKRQQTLTLSPTTNLAGNFFTIPFRFFLIFS